MMTLEQFRSTRRFVNDLGAALECDDFAEPGFVYIDQLYIRQMADGRLWLQLYAEEAVMTNSGENLALLETSLYEWACDEGYCDDEPATDETRSNGAQP